MKLGQMKLAECMRFNANRFCHGLGIILGLMDFDSLEWGPLAKVERCYVVNTSNIDCL